MATRTDWLNAGLRILATDGVAALTIDRLAESLALSKGSFYHHFAGMPAFRTALVAHYETTFTTRYIEAAERLGDVPPAARLRHLLDHILAERDMDNLEPAFRAWAERDPEARSTMERVDATRVAYLRDQWSCVAGDPDEAAIVARLLYVVLVGSREVLPRIPMSEQRRMYELLLSRLAGAETR